MTKVFITTLQDGKNTSILKYVTDRLVAAFWKPDDIRNEKEILASAMGHFMIQQMLLEHGIDRVCLANLSRNTYGKWILPGSSIDFNISHSGNKVVAVLANSGVVGIDIEETTPIRWLEYEDSFSSDEWTLLCRSNEPEKTFFDLWTKKESLSKAYGFGLQIPLNKIQVNGRIGIIQGTNLSGHFYPLFIAGYSGCVCSSEEQEFSVHHFSLP